MEALEKKAYTAPELTWISVGISDCLMTGDDEVEELSVSGGGWGPWV